ncbi:ABC transporter substrate-binding protein [Brachybacterium hainanense]|uniref:ABC transporter substrate-binding protein n=1 Tax=Brachybacterium hainanense TaxID=1541174 RepID=A0ABV6RH67_9MICO
MPSRRQLLASLAALGIASTASACGRGSGEDAEPDEDTLVLRIWDERAVAPYEEALRSFTEESGIEVAVEAQAWDEYWTALPQDLATKSAADVYWMNTANLVQLQQAESIVEVGSAVGDAAGAWETAATELYRREDVLWGVPQLWNVSMLAADRALVDPVEVDPRGLVFDPAGGNDTLREAALATMAASAGSGTDAREPVYGFSAQADRTGVLGPFIAGAGGAWQGEDDAFSFASEQGISAVQYLADLAGVDLAAPPGVQTAADPALCRDLFIGGRLALLQSGSYDLPKLVAGIDGAFAWDLHPVVAGPQGRRPLVHATAAVGIATDSEDRTAAIAELLAFLGTADAQRGLVATGLGIPAHRDLRGAWQEHWSGQGVDVAPLLEDMGQVAMPELGARSAAGTAAAMTIIQEVFTGEAEAAEALPRAQAAANEAAAA